MIVCAHKGASLNQASITQKRVSQRIHPRVGIKSPLVYYMRSNRKIASVSLLDKKVDVLLVEVGFIKESQKELKEALVAHSEQDQTRFDKLLSSQGEANSQLAVLQASRRLFSISRESVRNIGVGLILALFGYILSRLGF